MSQAVPVTKLHCQLYCTGANLFFYLGVSHRYDVRHQQYQTPTVPYLHNLPFHVISFHFISYVPVSASCSHTKGVISCCFESCAAHLRGGQFPNTTYPVLCLSSTSSELVFTYRISGTQNWRPASATHSLQDEGPRCVGRVHNGRQATRSKELLYS
jgi:hypothetical protein